MGILHCSGVGYHPQIKGDCTCIILFNINGTVGYHPQIKGDCTEELFRTLLIRVGYHPQIKGDCTLAIGDWGLLNITPNKGGTAPVHGCSLLFDGWISPPNKGGTAASSREGAKPRRLDVSLHKEGLHRYTAVAFSSMVGYHPQTKGGL